MKEFSYCTTERGMNINIMFCAKTKKDAAKLLNINLYTLNNYCYCYEPKTAECIKNPYLRFAMADSGEMWYAKPEWKMKLIKYIDMCQFINEYRKIYPNYKATMKAYERKQLPWQTLNKQSPKDGNN